MAVATASYAPVTDSQGKQVDPTTATVLADTGEVPGGLYEARILVGCTVAATFNVQHRDSANTGNVTDTILIRAAAGQTGQYVIKYDVKHNERIRVLPEANITGSAEATVSIARVA